MTAVKKPPIWGLFFLLSETRQTVVEAVEALFALGRLAGCRTEGTGATETISDVRAEFGHRFGKWGGGLHQMQEQQKATRTPCQSR